MWKSFLQWLNTPPKESELFGVNIREIFQFFMFSFKRKSKKSDKILCHNCFPNNRKSFLFAIYKLKDGKHLCENCGNEFIKSTNQTDSLNSIIDVHQ